MRIALQEAAVIAAIFVTSRLIYGLLGVNFDASTLPGYMQFIDIELLRSSAIESIWNFHAHPPGLNTIAALGVNIFGDYAQHFFFVVFHLLGLALASSVFILTRKMTKSLPAAIVTTTLLCFSPAFVLYENWLMYTFPTAALLGIAAACLYQYAETRHFRWALAFFSALAIAALTRSLFHIVWLFAMFALSMALIDNRRRTLVAAAGPVAVVVGWYAKNFVLFGTFAASSMAGLGLSNITTLTMPREQLLPLVEQQVLSPFALVSRYTETEILFDTRNLEPTGIRVLDEPRKSTGQYNFNFLPLIEINRYYANDAVQFIRSYPFNYVLGTAISNRLFFSPSSMNEYFSEQNRAAAAPIEAAYNRLLHGVPAQPQFLVQPHFGFSGEPSLEVNTSLPLMTGWALLCVFAYLLVRRMLVGGTDQDRARAIVAGFIAANMFWVWGTGTLVELAENYRYKFLVEPLVYVLAATAVMDLLRRFTGQRRGK